MRTWGARVPRRLTAGYMHRSYKGYYWALPTLGCGFEIRTVLQDAFRQEQQLFIADILRHWIHPPMKNCLVILNVQGGSSV